MQLFSYIPPMKNRLNQRFLYSEPQIQGIVYLLTDIHLYGWCVPENDTKQFPLKFNQETT